MVKLVATKLQRSFGKKEALRGIDIELNEGEVVGLLGPNGAGKTTAFRILVGLLSADAGRVYLNGYEITNMPLYRRARLGLGYLPQEPSVLNGLTVYENIQAILEFLQPCPNKRKELIQQLLKKFSIEDVADQKVYKLSGGQRRRVELARLFATRPKFLLLDEPFTGLDPQTVHSLQELILTLRNNDIGILLTDHRVREVLEITDRAYIIYDGNILREGNSAELVEDEVVKKVYFGEKFKI